MTNFEKQNMEWNMVESEAERIFAQPIQSAQVEMVQSDMKQWAIENNLWAAEPYKDMVVLHAIDRGWLQANFTGLEMPHDDC
jgi:hypothetical protein